MAYMNVVVAANDVIDTMLEDDEFAKEMWLALAHGLDAGRLMDDACDMIANHHDATIVANKFHDLSRYIKARCNT
jgi:hypothetical protein